MGNEIFTKQGIRPMWRNQNGFIWRPFGVDHLAPTIWLWAVLSMSCFGESACLVDYYYVRVAVSKTWCFRSCSVVFQEGNCFFKEGNKYCAFAL